MTLTAHTLTIDQSRPGWLDRARAEGPQLLAGAGCPALARELKSALQAGEALPTLSRYLRLESRPGSAPAFVSCVTPQGSLDGARFSPGGVPRDPHKGLFVDLEAGSVGPQAAGAMLVAGETVVTLSNLRRNLAAHLSDATGRWSRPWDAAEPTDVMLQIASDGVHLAVLRMEGDPADGSGFRPLCLELRRLDDGKVLWRQENVPTDPRSLDKTEMRLLVRGERVVLYSHTPDGLLAYDVTSGQEVWRRSLWLSGGEAEPLICHGERLCLLTRRRHVALELQGGRELWDRPNPYYAVQHLCSDEHVYLVCRGGATVWRRLSDGDGDPIAPALIGLRPGEKELLPGQVAIAGTRAVFASGGEMVAVSLEDQRTVLWRRERLAAGRDNDERVFIVGDAVIRSAADAHGNHRLRAYRLEDGQDLWEGIEMEVDGRPNAAWGHPQGLLVPCSGGRVYQFEEEWP